MFKLRELEREDLQEITKWRSVRATINCLGAPFRYIGSEIDERWFDAYLQKRSSTVRCVVIAEEKPHEPLALVTLSNINWVHRAGVFHIQVSTSSQKKGVGTFGTEEMLRHAFLDLGLNRVELTVLKSNAQARRLYEKAGFVEEGCKRKAVFKNGHFEDMLEMGILREEWEAL